MSFMILTRPNIFEENKGYKCFFGSVLTSHSDTLAPTKPILENKLQFFSNTNFLTNLLMNNE